MIATVVVAHPARIEWAERLAADLDGSVVMDTEGRGAGGNHREALRVGLETGAEWVLSLEDDAVPVAGLLGHVEVAIEWRPEQILGLYVGRRRPRTEQVAEAVRRADRVGASWLTYCGLLWGVATVWPAPLARDFLATDPRSDHLWDVHVRHWCRNGGHVVAYTWPSLVDHQDDASVIDRPTAPKPGRIAYRVGVPDWNDRATPIP